MCSNALIKPTTIAVRLSVGYLTHQKLGNSWLENWRSILKYCQNYSSLEYLGREIRAQSEQFADLPEVMASLNRIWRDRCQELAATG